MSRAASVRATPWRVLGAALASVLAAGASADAQQGSKLYVVNQAGATISVIDQDKLAIDTVLDLRTLGFTPNAKPHHVAVENDGSFWYVSLIGDGRVLKFDRANRLVGQVRLETPGLLSLDPVHDSLYVGRSMTAVNPPKAIGVIARRPFTLVEEHEIVIPRPHALAVSLDGAWVHTASLAENRIASIEVKTGRVRLTTIPGVARSLVQFALSPDGRWMVAGGELSNTLLVFDLTSPPPFTPAREVPLAGKPWEVRFSPDGRTVYVTLLAKNGVAELDASTWQVKRTMEEKFAQPYGMILRGDGRYAFVTNQNAAPVHEGHSGHAMHGMDGQAANNGWLTILDLMTGTVRATLPLGNGPTGAGSARAR